MELELGKLTEPQLERGTTTVMKCKLGLYPFCISTTTEHYENSTLEILNSVLKSTEITQIN